MKIFLVLLASFVVVAIGLNANGVKMPAKENWGFHQLSEDVRMEICNQIRDMKLAKLKLARQFGSFVKKFIDFNEDEMKNVDADKYARDNDLDKTFRQINEKYGNFVRMLCKSYEVDWKIVIARAAMESSGKEDVVNPAPPHATGIMQVGDAAWYDYGRPLGYSKEDMKDAEKCFRTSIIMLADLKEKMKSDAGMVLSYHYGPTGAREMLEKYKKPVSEFWDWRLTNAIAMVGTGAPTLASE